MENLELVNSLQQAIQNMAMSDNVGGQSLGCLQGSGLGWPYYQYYYPQYVTCSHGIGPDEELLLNAIRRSPALKTRILKAALEGLLKEMGKEKENGHARSK